MDEAAGHSRAARPAIDIFGRGLAVSTLRTCPGCSWDRTRLLLRTSKRTPSGELYQVVMCTRCDLRYTQPIPADDELAELYPETYYVSNRRNWLSADVLRRAFEHGV